MKKTEKSFSILGDSFSTYQGWIPSGYPSWFGEWEMNIRGVEETWWHLLMEHTGLRLLTNCSYSGSTVCLTGYEGMAKGQSFIDRMKDYFSKDEDVRADILLVEGGINDTYASPVGRNQYADWTENNLKCALPAYCYMLDYLKKNNPDTRIICMIAGTLVSQELQKGYLEACGHYGAEYLIFAEGGLKDGHPDADGHRTIFEQVEKYIRK